ncbi:hypothetical protein JWJ90_10480 [Desulfobulbus rhabdoformis]|uniref:hypothetical protein n=1 Tax=Desulfobulbus rhabdoformis TaxID=34032 RepID=UPI0019655F2D|nr:hypothetical protein [Desulfobulbus rhabdoformis]MBM9614712.1 hypothetical protein [Desulfobulbus rhabdoformis]
MSYEDHWELLVQLDEELLKGGVILSEWCRFIVREADTAYCAGAHLASILISVSGIETYLRSEYSRTGNERLVELIHQAPIDNALKVDLHILRKYRNKWVHIDVPWDDEDLIQHPENTEQKLEEMAFFAARTLRRVIYENQWL